MKNLIMSVMAVSVVSVAIAASEYDDYVWLNTSDVAANEYSSFFENTEGRWQKKDADGVFQNVETGPCSGEKYYVPSDKILTTPNALGVEESPKEYKFEGEELVVAGRLQQRLKRATVDSLSDYANVRIDNLVLLEDGEIYSGAQVPASVSGTCTIQGTKNNPSAWLNGYLKSLTTVILKSKLLGKTDSVFKFEVSSKTANSTTFKYMGDASEYLGTILLNSSYAKLNAATPNGLKLAGTLNIKNGAIFEVPAGSTATIGSLDSNGGVLSLGADNENSQYATLVITNKVNFRNKKITINYPRAFGIAEEKCELLRLTPDSPATISEDDFVLSGCSIADGEQVVCTNPNLSLSLSVEKLEDGSRVLYVSHRALVYNDEKDRKTGDDKTGSVFLPTYASCWSNDSEISEGNDYYIISNVYAPNSANYQFKGASLTICETGRISFDNSSHFNVPDFRWVASQDNSVKIWNWNASSVVSGKVSLPKVDDKKFVIQSWNGGDPRNGKEYNNSFTIASDLYGDGTLGFTSLTDAGSDSRAFYLLIGNNNNFVGKIHLYHGAFGGSSKEKYEANPDKYCVTLYVSNNDGLGGAMPAFAKDALLLANHSLLKTQGSLTFDEPTRGWSIEGVGRVHVYENETLTVANKQFTYAGEFHKEGDGLFKLGGTAKFTAEAVDTPTEGMNILKVEAGSIMPTDLTAFDGLEVYFAEGAKLMLNLSETGDLAKYGMYNVKWDNPIVVAEDKALPVAFEVPANFDNKVNYRIGILTVNPTAAANIDVSDFVVKAPTSMKAKVSKVENKVDDVVVSVTYVCDLTPAGFQMIVR